MPLNLSHTLFNVPMALPALIRFAKLVYGNFLQTVFSFRAPGYPVVGYNRVPHICQMLIRVETRVQLLFEQDLTILGI